MPQDPQKKPKDEQLSKTTGISQLFGPSGFFGSPMEAGKFYFDQSRKEEQFGAQNQRDGESHNLDMVSKVMDMRKQDLEIQKQAAETSKAQSDAAIKQYESDQVQGFRDDSMFDAGFDALQPGAQLQSPQYSPERRIAADQYLTAVALQNAAVAKAGSSIPQHITDELFQQYAQINPEITQAMKPENLYRKSLTEKPALGFIGSILGGAVDLVTAPFRDSAVFQGPGTDVFGGNVGKREAAELLELRRQLDPLLALKVQTASEEASQTRGLSSMLFQMAESNTRGQGGDPVLARHSIEDFQSQGAYVQEGIRNFKTLSSVVGGPAGRMFGAGVLGGDEAAQGVGNDLLAGFISLQDPSIAGNDQLRSILEANIQKVIKQSLEQNVDVLAELKAGITQISPGIQQQMRSDLEGKGERAVRNKLAAATSLEQTLQSFLNYIEQVQVRTQEELFDEETARGARAAEAEAKARKTEPTEFEKILKVGRPR